MAGRIVLERLTRQDWDMVGHWLEKPYIRKWFGNPEDWLKEIKNTGGEYWWISHFIACCAGQPIGYCRYFDCSKTEAGFPWENEPTGTFGIDYLIGRQEFLGQGLGSEIVEAISYITMAERRPIQLVATALEENTPSVRALVSKGYRLDKESGLYKYICCPKTAENNKGSAF